MVHSEHTSSLYYIIEASAISPDGSINGISKLANAGLWTEVIVLYLLDIIGYS